jgi:hypothetical protein
MRRASKPMTTHDAVGTKRSQSIEANYLPADPAGTNPMSAGFWLPRRNEACASGEKTCCDATSRKFVNHPISLMTDAIAPGYCNEMGRAPYVATVFTIWAQPTAATPSCFLVLRPL